MALHTIATVASGPTTLPCLAGWSQSLSDADIAAIAQSICPDNAFASVLGGGGAGISAVVASGDTHSNVTVDSLSAVSGSPPLTQIDVGDVVLGFGIPPGTYVRSISGTTATLSQAATATNSGISVAFVRRPSHALDRTARLVIPNRGIIRLQDGDVVAIDNTGFPYVIPAASINLTGSQWTFT